MDVLTEDGELLGEVTIALSDLLEARRRIDAALRPVVERVRTAAADAEVEHAGCLGHRIALRLELRECRREAGLDRAVQLDHAEGHLGLDCAGHLHLRQALDQVAGFVREIPVVPAHQLQLDLDAEAKALRVAEFHRGRHQFSGCASPACLSANCVARGPMISSSATAESTTAASSAPKRG